MADQRNLSVGKQAPTQLGRALQELGIEQIPAYSPQASPARLFVGFPLRFQFDGILAYLLGYLTLGMTLILVSCETYDTNISVI